MKLSIVIPCYNEEKNLPLIADKFSKIIDREDVEVILVDNGSTDNSSKVISQIITQYSFLKTVKVDKNQGYGFGIITGLKMANGDFIGWTHADLQTDPKDVLLALELIEKNNSDKNLYIKGSRRGRGIFDNVFTLGMSVFETLYLRTILWEINAQPNIFHKNFFATWKNPPFDFALDLYSYYKAKKQNLKIIRFPVLFPKRIHGQSSWNNSFADKWKFIKRTINFSAKLKKNLEND